MTETKCSPRGLARRQAILAAARELFLAQGFARTSLSEIIERAGGSRRTLYEQFGNKEGLLRAIVADTTGRVWAALRFPPEGAALDAAALFEIGRSFLTAGSSPDNIAMFRIIVAVGPTMPEIAALFFDSGPRQLRARLTELFDAAQRDGRFTGGEPSILAQAFAGLMLGDVHMRNLIGLATPPDAATVDTHVATALALFLKGAERAG